MSNAPTGNAAAAEDGAWGLGDWRGWVAAAVLVSVYLVLRLVGLRNALWVEDHDSISYLVQIEQVLRDGIGAIWSFGPDATPFYPLAGAFFASLGGSAELGARLASMFSSLLMLAALFDIGRRVATPAAVAAGLLLVAFNPLLIKLSYAVLTEPSFVATFYIALWIFWIQYRNPRLGVAALLGVVAGLAFLNRLEGILYLAFFPALQAVHYFFADSRRYDVRRLASWTGVFAVCFGALAVPQVVKVSDQMGRPALNGRQAWVAMLNQGDQGYEEAIYGLDYDPGIANLDYVQSRPEVLGQMQSGVDPRAMLRRVVLNFDELNNLRLGELLGAVGLALFGLGLVDLWSRRRRFEALFVLAVIGVGVAAPLAHNVVPRHIAVIIPIMLLTAGIGAHYAARALVTGGSQALAGRGNLLTAVITVAALAGWGYPLSVPLRGLDRPNMEYHPDDFIEPVEIVQSLSEGDPPVIVTRKSYFAYFAGGGHERRHLPHTNYEGLVRFSRINGVDFLFLRHNAQIRDRPLMSAFTGEEAPPHFELLYRGVGSNFGEKLELYRFLPEGGDSP